MDSIQNYSNEKYDKHLYCIHYFGSPLHRGEPRGGVQLPPPPKFRSWAKFRDPWKINPQQPNKNTSFTHLQIEWNP
jgi:hypothetical protein